MTSKTTSKTTKNVTTKAAKRPAIGSFWRDNDPRQDGKRIVEVVKINGDYAYCRSYDAGEPSDRLGLRRISIDRLRPISAKKGYTQVSSASEVAPSRSGGFAAAETEQPETPATPEPVKAPETPAEPAEPATDAPVDVPADVPIPTPTTTEV